MGARFSTARTALAIIALAGNPTVGTTADAGAPALAPLSIATQILSAQPGTTLTLAIGDTSREVDVSREGVSGGSVYLNRSGPDELSGNLGADAVVVRLGTGRVAGTIGDRAISLDVLRSPRLLRIDGRFGDKAIVLEVAPDRVAGEVGACLYNLHFNSEEGAYLGHVSCGGPPESVRLSVPVGLMDRGDPELAALFTAMLAR
jgi:hypothetical protein